MDYEYRPMFRVAGGSLLHYEQSIDREGRDLERDTIQLHTSCYPFHHVMTLKRGK